MGPTEKELNLWPTAFNAPKSYNRLQLTPIDYSRN